MVGYRKQSFGLFPSPHSNMPNWFLEHIKDEMKRKIFPPLSVNLDLVFPSKPIDNYLEVKIDPKKATKWELRVQPFKYRFHTISSMLKRAFDDINEFMMAPTAVNHSFFPGTFDKGLASSEGPVRRYYVDGRDVDNAVLFILQETILNFKDSTIDYLSVDHLVNQLRFRNLTVPKNSLLWRLVVRLFDACSHSPHHLSYDVGMIPLLRGVWNDLVAYFRYCWDQAVYIPNVNILIQPKEVGINREYNLLHQKLCMINCCIYRKSGRFPDFGAEFSGESQFGMNDTSGIFSWLM
jgi:hypothetical protein